MSADMFNEGYSAILSVMQLLNLSIGEQCKMFADISDTQRIEREYMRQTFRSKETRTARRLDQMHKSEAIEEVEGILYGPGITG